MYSRNKINDKQLIEKKQQARKVRETVPYVK